MSCTSSIAPAVPHRASTSMVLSHTSLPNVLGMILALHIGERGLACSRLHPYDSKCDIHCILHRVKKAIVLHAEVSAIERDIPLHDNLVLPLFYGHRNGHALGHAAHLQVALHRILQAISGNS